MKEECEALTLARSTESAKQTSCEATRAREASGCEATVCEADPVRAAQQWATQPVLAGDYVARSAYSLKPANLFKRVIHPALRRGQAAHAEHVCHRFRAASEAEITKETREMRSALSLTGPTVQSPTGRRSGPKPHSDYGPWGQADLC